MLWCVSRTLLRYSIGPDMVDDGGKPLDRENETGDVTLELSDHL